MYFIVSRNTPKLLIVVLLPAFCLVVLSSFGLVIPIASGEKLGYSVTVLLAFYVYKEAVEDMMAPWQDYDETPTLIGLFTAITMSKLLLKAFFIPQSAPNVFKNFICMVGVQPLDPDFNKNGFAK